MKSINQCLAVFRGNFFLNLSSFLPKLLNINSIKVINFTKFYSIFLPKVYFYTTNIYVSEKYSFSQIYQFLFKSLQKNILEGLHLYY
jgi:hypothetical protein